MDVTSGSFDTVGIKLMVRSIDIAYPRLDTNSSTAKDSQLDPPGANKSSPNSNNPISSKDKHKANHVLIVVWVIALVLFFGTGGGYGAYRYGLFDLADDRTITLSSGDTITFYQDHNPTIPNTDYYQVTERELSVDELSLLLPGVDEEIRGAAVFNQEDKRLLYVTLNVGLVEVILSGEIKLNDTSADGKKLDYCNVDAVRIMAGHSLVIGSNLEKQQENYEEYNTEKYVAAFQVGEVTVIVAKEDAQQNRTSLETTISQVISELAQITQIDLTLLELVEDQTDNDKNTTKKVRSASYYA